MGSLSHRYNGIGSLRRIESLIAFQNASEQARLFEFERSPHRRVKLVFDWFLSDWRCVHHREGATHDLLDVSAAAHTILLRCRVRFSVDVSERFLGLL